MAKAATGLGEQYLTVDGIHFRKSSSYSHRTRPKCAHYVRALSAPHAKLLWNERQKAIASLPTKLQENNHEYG